MRIILVIAIFLTTSNLSFAQSDCKLYQMFLDTLYSDNVGIIFPNAKYPMNVTEANLDTTGAYKVYDEFNVYVLPVTRIVFVEEMRIAEGAVIPQNIVDGKPKSKKIECFFDGAKYCVRKVEGKLIPTYSQVERCDKTGKLLKPQVYEFFNILYDRKKTVGVTMVTRRDDAHVIAYLIKIEKIKGKWKITLIKPNMG